MVVMITVFDDGGLLAGLESQARRVRIVARRTVAVEGLHRLLVSRPNTVPASPTMKKTEREEDEEEEGDEKGG